ncbi:MAG: bifunctional phosphoribosylaminoimidazolecarboxamide formyltransferase/inosine monophosphate cyclohydrolase [Acidobacteria bacterium]|nr:MAG: bifunctional phosphoribosylaminoimidazolecarboxamide formyltransferase/inosine monophosphate cyclohydrolase [Acidobacteriota bacterium]
MKQVRRALLSVSDKTGVAEFAAGLAELGAEILSTGGTAKLLRERGVKVRDVSDLTGFPEMLDGRVKTLHPKVHGGILAVRSNPEHQRQAQSHGIELIDLVAVNLYPFEKTATTPGVRFEEIIENIDIGGPAMIRSAAKNFADVAVAVDPADYSAILDEMRANGGALADETRARLARKAFASTAAYDGAISMTLQKRASTELLLVANLHLDYAKVMDLRYGENPHQKAALYRDRSGRTAGLAQSRQLQGKALSFNNFVDLEAAWGLAREFTEPATVIIKHTNPCGVATGATQLESYTRALDVDPVSAFGSVIAFNRPLDAATAEAMSKLFVEAVVAPGFAPEVIERLSAKKNLRLLEFPANASEEGRLDLKTVGGGLLVQSPDCLPAEPGNWKCVTERAPTDEETRALVFAWRVTKHVKSNAIVFAREGVAVGVGAGQMSRVDSVKLAIAKARELKHALEGTVVGSDAFFPFPDGVEEAGRAGATAIVQPGGSVRDAEVVAASNRLGLAMMFTAIRHFRH